MLFAAGGSFQSREVFGAEAALSVPVPEHIWLKDGGRIPAFIAFRPGTEQDEEGFFFWLKQNFRLPANYSAQLIRREKDQIGMEHARYQLMVVGHPAS
jgi:hypothetical protein